MLTRYVIFARVYVGAPVSRWFETTSVAIGPETTLIDDLIAGQIDGAIDRIEAYNIDDMARDVSEDIALALGARVLTRMAEDGYRPTDELRNFIEHHTGLDFAIPAKAFESARVREDA